MSLETKLKIEGKFNQYATEKMKANAESFFADADQEVEALKKSFDDPISFLQNSHGLVENWEVKNPEFFKEQIDNQYNEYKQNVMDKLNNPL